MLTTQPCSIAVRFFFFIRRALVGTSDRLTSEDYNSSERLEGRENSVRLCAT